MKKLTDLTIADLVALKTNYLYALDKVGGLTVGKSYVKKINLITNELYRRTQKKEELTDD